MNHYERLKVLPEAPPEVIRAAYRALAAKLHPDRKVGDSGPGDSPHEDMAALNASYLVLIDAKARQAYDQSLAAQAHASAQAAADKAGPARDARDGRNSEPKAKDKPTSPAGARAAMRFGKGREVPEHANAADAGPETRIELDWSPVGLSARSPWFRQREWILAMAASLLIGLAGLIWWGAQLSESDGFDRHVAAQSPEAMAQQGQQWARDRAAASGASTPLPGASAPALTESQLERMSDAELLAAMPQLLGGKAPSLAATGASGAAGPTAATVLAAARAEAAASPDPEPVTLLTPPQFQHPLDGQPLDLKLAPLKMGVPR